MFALQAGLAILSLFMVKCDNKVMLFVETIGAFHMNRCAAHSGCTHARARTPHHMRTAPAHISHVHLAERSSFNKLCVVCVVETELGARVE